MFDKFAVEMLRNGGVKGNLGQTEGENDTLYLSSSGWTAIAVSPSIVSGRVVATTIFSSIC